MNTDDRARRRAADGGDPDETVLVRKGSHGSSKAYHDASGDCEITEGLADERLLTMTREQAQTRGWYPCKRCVLEDVAESGYPAKDIDTSPALLMEREDVTSIDDLRAAMADATED